MPFSRLIFEVQKALCPFSYSFYGVQKLANNIGRHTQNLRTILHLSPFFVTNSLCAKVILANHSTLNIFHAKLKVRLAFWSFRRFYVRRYALLPSKYPISFFLVPLPHNVHRKIARIVSLSTQPVESFLVHIFGLEHYWFRKIVACSQPRPDLSGLSHKTISPAFLLA